MTTTVSASRPGRAWLALLTASVAVASLSAAACSSTLDPPSGDPRLDLQHRDPTIRVRAALQVVEDKRQDMIPLLIENLSHRDGAVRLYTHAALRKLTEQDFGYLPHATFVEREKAITRWRAWAERREEAT